MFCCDLFELNCATEEPTVTDFDAVSTLVTSPSGIYGRELQVIRTLGYSGTSNEDAIVIQPS